MGPRGSVTLRNDRFADVAPDGGARWNDAGLIRQPLPGKPRAQDLEAALATHYADAKWVTVVKADDQSAKVGRLDALALNDTNLLELRVFSNERHGHAVLVARLDILGKGASGVAVQNIGIMLGVDT
jgi:N-acetyl-gamma-glutamyl-phosphate reductase